jgi:hypothetical protein
MNLTSLTTDNISEVLNLMIEFTQIRQRILIQNITSIYFPGYVPKELEVEEFSDLLNCAIDEHIRTNRLVLRDTKNIKFGLNGDFKITPVEDLFSKELIEDDIEKYIELQIDKLWENSVNQKVAAELLKQKQEPFSVNY